MTSVTTPRGRRVTLVVAAGALVLGSLVPAAAQTEEDRARVQRQLQQAQEQLNHSSRAFSDATAAYEAASSQLPAAEQALAAAEEAHAAAQAALAEAQGQLVAARAADAAAAEKLAAAEEDVRLQEERIVEISGRIDEKQTDIGRIAARAYQQGALADLADVAAVLESTSVEEFNARVTYVQAALTSEGTIVADMRDDRAALANERVVLEELRAVARRLREEAAAHLARTQELEAAAREAAAHAAASEQQAREAKAQVEQLVAQRTEAKEAAESAKAEDARIYADLEAERRRIEAEIAERVRLAREKAEREARQKAEREARERAEREAREQAEREAAARAQGSGGSSGGGGSAPAPDRPPPPPPPPPPAEPASSGFRRPVAGRVTSPYGMRTHPITGVYKMHDGTDFRAPCGTPIRATYSGEVVWARYRGGYGNQVMVDHGWYSGGSMMSSYSHLSRFAVGRGADVSRGEVIGYSGTTGSSTACHLHFMIYRNGSTTNPMRWL